MNFFKGPNFDSINILAVLLIVAGAGYFLFSSGGDRGLDSSGKVIKNTATDGSKVSISFSYEGDSCTMTTCADIDGTNSCVDYDGETIAVNKNTNGCLITDEDFPTVKDVEKVNSTESKNNQ